MIIMEWREYKFALHQKSFYNVIEFTKLHKREGALRGWLNLKGEIKKPHQCYIAVVHTVKGVKSLNLSSP